MNDEQREQAYWLLLAFGSKLAKRVISDIIENWCRQRSGTLEEFFSLSAQQRSDICLLDENSVAKLTSACERIADQVALVAQLMKRGVRTGNKALLELGGHPLYWPIENDVEESPIEDVISPLLESELLNQKQSYIPALSVQISRLLEEQQVYS